LDLNTKEKIMKNIFAIIVLFLAFTNAVAAQESNKKDPNILAKNETNLILKSILLDNEIVILINGLLIYKHETVLKYPERKEEVALTISDKLKGILTTEQFSKIKKDKVLFNDLLY
jgi:hypothetical protein